MLPGHVMASGLFRPNLMPPVPLHPSIPLSLHPSPFSLLPSPFFLGAACVAEGLPETVDVGKKMK